ncbi:MAG: divalent-cation tolerance protein CutA [Deltaproteobacteria bacterium]|nr:divalent-cation tolerance protein CutA [Deltaproteobacteria bacterium]
MTECIQVITTVAVQEDADKLARLVLEQRLAACIQITPCRSFYHWQGAIEQDNELKLVMKSSVNLYPQLEKFILDHHPYDTPEILAVPVQFGNSGYLDWLTGELKQE